MIGGIHLALTQVKNRIRMQCQINNVECIEVVQHDVQEKAAIILPPLPTSRIGVKKSTLQNQVKLMRIKEEYLLALRAILLIDENYSH